MFSKVIFFFICFFYTNLLTAQSDSSLVKAESTQVKINKTVTDSLPKSVPPSKKFLDTSVAGNTNSSIRLHSISNSLKKDSTQSIIGLLSMRKDTATYAAVLNHPFLPFNQQPLYELIQQKVSESQDELFYLVAALVALVGLVRLLFSKYFNDIFTLFFQTSFRQRHTKDQLLQYNLASLVMNLLFFITGSLYIQQIAWQTKIMQVNFWLLLLSSFLALLAVYGFKYLFLRFLGWIFNVQTATNGYIFIVFAVNKILGIVLIPFILLMAFSAENLAQGAVTISLIVLVILFLYRYVVSLGTIRKEVKVSAIHFFLYLCSVEIVPILLMYKVLFKYIANNN
jgi:hypothetical protein